LMETGGKPKLVKMEGLFFLKSQKNL